MPEDDAAARLEKKVDAVAEAVAKLDHSHTRMTEQMIADKRLTDQLIGFMQQAVDRLQGQVDDDRHDLRDQMLAEKTARELGDTSIRATLSRIAYALFTALLTLIVAGLAYVLFQTHT